MAETVKITCRCSNSSCLFVIRKMFPFFFSFTLCQYLSPKWYFDFSTAAVTTSTATTQNNNTNG